MLHSNLPANLQNSAVATALEKVSFHSYPKERQCQRMLKHTLVGEGNGTPLQHSCLKNPMGRGAWWAAVHGVAKSRTWLSEFTFTFHFHALEKEMATYSTVLAWRIPGMAETGGLPSMGSHRVGGDWSDLAAAAHTGKVMLKILQARLQQYMHCELPDVQAGFRKGRGSRNQIANIWWIIKKAREFAHYYINANQNYNEISPRTGQNGHH